MSITLPYISFDGSVIDYVRPIADGIPTGKGYAPPVTTYAARPLDTLDSDCNFAVDVDGSFLRDAANKRICVTKAHQEAINLVLGPFVSEAESVQHKCEYYLRFGYEKDGLRYAATVPAPDLVQPADDSPVFEFGGVFTPFADGGAYVIDPTLVADPYLGFSDEDMDTVVWVEGQQFGIETAPEVSIISETLPNFSVSRVHGPVFNFGDIVSDCVANVLDAKTGRLRQCAGIVSFREFALQSRSERENMEAYVLLLADHRVEYHSGVTHEDMCVHGERNYVAAISRSTGQPFAAKFCKRGQSKTACQPVWCNVDSTRTNEPAFRGSTKAHAERWITRLDAAEMFGADIAPGTLDVLAEMYL